jgi:hypothetical protein
MQYRLLALSQLSRLPQELQLTLSPQDLTVSERFVHTNQENFRKLRSAIPEKTNDRK